MSITFGAHEVVIVTRFNDELYQFADVDVVEAFMAMNAGDRKSYVDAFVINGNNDLTYLYLKLIIFKLENGHIESVVLELEDLGVEFDKNCIFGVAG